MIGERQRRFVGSPRQRVATPIQTAIVRLAEAHDYACDSECDLWEFAVEIDELTAIGLSLDDLRWLVAGGYVRHGREVTGRSDAARRFRPARNPDFTRTTCFVLTDAGLQLTTVEPAGTGLKRAA